MVLQRWDPFRDLRRIENTVDRFWRGFGAYEAGGWAVPLDVVQDGDSIVIHGTLPGVKAEDISVTIDDGVLEIKAESKTDHEEQNGNYLIRERRAGKFHRVVRLPDSVDADKAETRYEDGVLTVRLPKVEARKAKVLEVKAGK